MKNPKAWEEQGCGYPLSQFCETALAFINPRSSEMTTNCITDPNESKHGNHNAGVGGTALLKQSFPHPYEILLR